MRKFLTPSSITALIPKRGLAILLLVLLVACSAVSYNSGRPKTAEKWFLRAQHDFETADIDNAHDSITKALAITPDDVEIRMLAGRIALARLDYSETLRLLKGIPGSDAAGTRGRALWYKGELDAAADELEAMLNDPDVVDDWAKAIAKLARRGQGRTPFKLSGALLAPVEMPHISPVAPYLVVNLEIDGEKALALLSTVTGEVVLDSATRNEPSWISLRFGEKLEVRDVPAVVQDLSGLRKQLGGAEIRALLGVNLLRHLNATIDFFGRQFVVRSFAPPPPPNATRINLYYVRGGGMVLQSGLSSDKSVHSPLLVDTSMVHPLVLDENGWKKAGFEIAGLKPVEGDPEQKLKQGLLPVLRLGAYDIPKVPGVYGAPISDIEKQLRLDVDGIVGAGLLAHFRITFGDGGRLMWIEDDSSVDKLLRSAPPNPQETPLLQEGPGQGLPGQTPLMNQPDVGPKSNVPQGSNVVPGSVNKTQTAKPSTNQPGSKKTPDR